MSKILVTGANGFLGSHILKALLKKESFDVFGMIRDGANNELNQDILDKVHWINGDLLNLHHLEEAFSNVDIVIHSAALVSYNPKLTKELIQVNEEGTANVCNICAHLGIKKLIYISSIAALGQMEGQTIVDETAGWNPNSPHTNYALSKYKAEMEVWRSHYEGLPVTILNPSVILGIGRWDTSSLQFVPRLAKGGSIYPIGSTGFVDVKDVAELSIAAIDKKHTGHRYIVSGFNVSYKQLFDDITDRLGVRNPYIAMNPIISGLLWRLELIRSKLFGGNSLITKETAQSISTLTEYDNTKSISSFDFKYRSMDDTLNDMINAFKRTTN